MSSPAWSYRNYNKRTRLKHRRIAKEFNVIWPPVIGQIVCDCRYRHGIVTRISVKWDDVWLDDGFTCSIDHCIWPVPHDGMEHD